MSMSLLRESRDDDTHNDELICTKSSCYLCDCEFQQNEECYSLFEKRDGDTDGGDFSAISIILSSALGRVVDEIDAHSKYICSKCNIVLTEFEIIEQRYYHLKYKIINFYNQTATNNALVPIEFEMSGDIEEDSDQQLLQSDSTSHTIDHLEIIKPKKIKIEKKNEEVETVGSATNVADSKECIDNVTTSTSTNELYAVFKDFQPVAGLEYNDKQKTNDSLVIHSELTSEENDQPNLEESETYFDHNSGDIVEIITADHPYEQIINDNSLYTQEDSIESSSVEISIKDEIICDDAKSDVGNEYQNSQMSSTNSNSSIQQKSENFEEQSLFQFDESGYTCLLCELDGVSIKESNAELMSNHLKKVHNFRLYFCDVCCLSFKKRWELKNHKDQKHSSGQLDYKCQICSRIFTNLRLYRIHKRLHYSNKKNHQCYTCDKKFSSKNLLDEHRNMHTGERPYKCEECGKDYASKYTLSAHKRTHTERPRPHQCDKCEKAFFSAQNLLQHKRLHTGLKDFICEHCNKAFGSQNNLDVHKIVHTGNKPFICRTCGKGFARRAEIRDHERTHTGEKPFQCNLCPLAFAQRSNLSTHIRATHLNDKSHKCNDCDKSFKRRRLLEYHIQAVHTGERPHKCPHCSASFVYPEHFKKHMRIHTGDKPFACEVCNKMFNSRDNRNAHRYIHSDKKPYECLLCGQGFMRKPLLLAHMETMNHVNDTIVVNEPRLPVLAKNPTFEWNSSENNEIIYCEDEEIVDEDAEIIGTMDVEASMEAEYNEVNTDSSEARYIDNEDINSKYIQISNSSWVSVGTSEMEDDQ